MKNPIDALEKPNYSLVPRDASESHVRYWILRDGTDIGRIEAELSIAGAGEWRVAIEANVPSDEVCDVIELLDDAQVMLSRLSDR